jgi:acetylornithine/succinyldiaminopimelate/putrescine aminotransferase
LLPEQITFDVEEVIEEVHDAGPDMICLAKALSGGFAGGRRGAERARVALLHEQAFV